MFDQIITHIKELKVRQRVVLASVGMLLVLLGGYVIHEYSSEQRPSVNSQEFKTLTREEYARVLEEFTKLQAEQDPRVALQELRARIKTDEALLRSCHPLVHTLGRVAYAKYSDFGTTLQFQDEICNSGYLHGVIEAHFSQSKDIFQTLDTTCSLYPEGSFTNWECYHGIGHGLMYYTDNDLERSLDLCRAYETQFAQLTCANGVFMENFAADQKTHVSQYLKEDDLFYPCQEQTDQFKPECYMYAPTHYLSMHPNDYSGALEWCEYAEERYVTTCIGGVGSQAMKENMHNPSFVESICVQGGGYENSCIQGMVGLFVNHHGSLDPARQLCEEMDRNNKGTCYDRVRSMEPLFQ